MCWAVNTTKKESDYPQEMLRKLAEADSTVLDKTRIFGSTDNSIAVAPLQIGGKGDSSNLLWGMFKEKKLFKVDLKPKKCNLVSHFKKKCCKFS